MGAKRCLNGTSKVNTQTDGQTDGGTDRQTDKHFNLSKASAQRADALKTHIVARDTPVSDHSFSIKIGHPRKNLFGFYNNFFFKASALWADAFYKSKCSSVHLSVCPSVCSLLRYRLNVFLPPLPEVGCPIFLEIRNSWGKGMERKSLRFEHFCLKVV